MGRVDKVTAPPKRIGRVQHAHILVRLECDDGVVGTRGGIAVVWMTSAVNVTKAAVVVVTVKGGLSYKGHGVIE